MNQGTNPMNPDIPNPETVEMPEPVSQETTIPTGQSPDAASTNSEIELPAPEETPEAEVFEPEDIPSDTADVEAIPDDVQEAPSSEETVVSGSEAPEATLVFSAAGESDGLSHNLLDTPVVGDEIGADENALLHAGLTQHSDAEVDRIIDESKAISGLTPQQPFIDEEVREVFGENGEGLSDVFDDGVSEQPEEPEVPAEDPKEEEAVQKRRPGMKKGYGLLGIPHVIATAIWLAIVALIGISLGRMIWVCAAEVLAFGKPDKEYTFVVTDADNIDTIAAKLKTTGLIRYPELFKLYANLTDAQEDISAGTFTLNSKYDYHALVLAMSYHSPAREYIELLIPEGYTCAQIFALLEEEGVCTAAELEEYAANGEIKERWFLEGIQRGDKYCLEGYLFPDTYQFYTNDEPGRVLGKFLDNFDARFTDLMKSKLDPLNERLAAILADRGYDEETIEARKITIREVVIIASMIERETSNDAESYEISSVIYNRLTNPANFPYLNIDATLIYALNGNIDPETGKTKPLTSEDLKMDHPYNTYTVKGLIPGPISNPGRNSLNAALDPMETDYYFYVYNPNTSTHIFAKTAKEHDKNVQYVRSLTKEE